MPIQCQLCKKEFNKIIPWQHLKEHGVTSSAYKARFGSLYSQETLHKFKSRTPHNKGKKVTDAAQLENFRIAIALREKKFQEGSIKRGAPKTVEQKETLRKKATAYAVAYPDKVKARAVKAVISKKKRNLPGPMAGKSHTSETKNKIKEKKTAYNTTKQSKSITEIINRAAAAQVTLLSNLTDKKYNIRCNLCTTTFTLTKQYFFKSKFTSKMCPTCYPRQTTVSKGETEMYEFIKSLRQDSLQSYRATYHEKEIDIFIPSLNIGFEYNGLYWHSEEVLTANGKSKTADFEKYQYFKTTGIRVINIFEDEWKHKKEIVKSQIRSILRLTPTIISSQECTIKEITSKETTTFFNQNHITKNNRSSVNLGLFFNSELVSVMTFSTRIVSKKIKICTINNIASLLNCCVVGNASKLLKHFVNTYSPDQVIAYSDNRWSDGTVYKKLGFLKDSETKPTYWYLEQNQVCRISQHTFRKLKKNNQFLLKDQSKKFTPYSRIWDCGKTKWVWHKS
jgi:hypothetical protein